MRSNLLLAIPAVLSMALPSAPQSALTLVTQPQQGYTAIYDLMNSAQKTLDLTMYELTDTTAENDLVNAAARGVTVRTWRGARPTRSTALPAGPGAKVFLGSAHSTLVSDYADGTPWS